MKEKICIATAILAVFTLLALGCSPQAQSDGAQTEQTFTLEELAEYSGKDGNPAYIAVDGVVYDVSNVPEWANGDHVGQYSAGTDLTAEMKNESPHGVSKLEGLPIVGKLTE